MTIFVMCECGKQLRAHMNHAGKRARCTRCGKILTVPGTDLAAGTKVEIETRVEAKPVPQALPNIEPIGIPQPQVGLSRAQWLAIGGSILIALAVVAVGVQWILNQPGDQPLRVVAPPTTSAVKPALSPPVPSVPPAPAPVAATSPREPEPAPIPERVGEIHVLRGHDKWASSVSLSGNGRLGLTGSGDHALRLWDLAAGKERRKLIGHTGPVLQVALSADGKLALSASEDRTVRLWDTESGLEIRTLEGGGSLVRGLIISPDGRQVFTGGDDKVVRIWDAETGKPVGAFEGHSGPIKSLACSLDGRFLVSGSDDGTARVWDIEAGKQVFNLEGHQAEVTNVAFAPDGRRIATGTKDKLIRVWSAEDGRQTKRLEGHQGPITGVGFAAAGRWVVSTSQDKSLRVWDAVEGHQVHAFDLQDYLYALTVSPDGRHVLLAASDGSGRLYGLPKPGVQAPLAPPVAQEPNTIIDTSKPTAVIDPISPGPSGGGGGVAAPAEPKGGTVQQLGVGETNFFGTRSRGSKFVFVIDHSGSMAANRALDEAKFELAVSLGKLPEYTAFQIVVYNHNARIFPIDNSRELVLATKANKEKAMDYVRVLRPEGGTAHYVALDAALKLKPDIIYFLTDGISLTQAQARRLNEKNKEETKAIIHCVQLVSHERAQADHLLQFLAQENNGEYRKVEAGMRNR